MKRVLSLVLALVMLLAMFTVVGAAASPDPTQAPAEPTEVPADPAEVPAEPAADPADAPAEDPAEPAPQADTPEEPAEPTEKPAEPTAEPAEPSPEATETVTEPAPAADETTPEPAAAPTEEPAEPTAAPAAENSAEPSALPTEIPEQPTPTPDHRTVKLHANGGYFTGDHAGYDGFSKALVGDYLPKTGSEGKGDPGWYTPERAGYKFLGWYSTKDKANAHTGEALDEGDAVPKDVTDLWAGWEKLPRTVTLDATPGNFWDGAQAANNYTRTVTLTEGDKLPNELPTPTYDYTGHNVSVVFVGWYTKPTTVTEVADKSGAYQTWNIHPNGEQIQAGAAVDAGITTLYAGYQLKDQPEQGVKKITYYLHANGMGGSTGALQVTRPYKEGGVDFIVGNAAVIGINYSVKFDGEFASASTEAEKWDILKRIWDENTFDGYKFLGWYTAGGQIVEGGTGKDLPKITNGEHLYAYWSYGKTTQDTPQSTPEPAGPINGMHIDARHLTIRQDPNKPESVTIPLFVTPVGGTGTITWTVKVPPTVDLEHLSAAFKGETQTYTIVGDKITKADDGITKEGPNFTAKAEGLNLTIFPQKGCSQVLFVSAACGDVTTPADATVVITHTPEEQETVTQAATCTAEGEAAILCAECGEATEVHTLPATGHTYEAKQVRVESGAPVFEVACIRGDTESTEAKCGDANGDGRTSVADVSYLFKAVSGQYDQQFVDEVGDANGDGRVSVADVSYLFKYVSGQVGSIG